MNLQIDLFKDKSISNTYLKTLRRIERAGFNLNEDLDLGVYETFQPNDKFTLAHIQNVLKLKKCDRKYEKLFALQFDTHTELEKAGLSKSKGYYRVIVTLSDSLDFLLSLICHSDFHKFYENIKDYQTLSRGILDLNFDLFDDQLLESLIGVDETLDKDYFKLNKDREKIILRLYNDILSLAHSAVAYIAHYIKRAYKKEGLDLVFKSETFSTVVLDSPRRIDFEVSLNGVYNLKIKSYAPLEYINHVAESNRGDN